MLRPAGAVLVGVGAAQIICALGGCAIEWGSDRPVSWEDGLGLGKIGLLTVGVGLVLFAYGRRFARERFMRREALIAVVVIWASTGLFGALPFSLLAGLAPIDALFETVSGLSTTGTTVIADLESRLSPPLHLWRAMISWLGGMGIVVLFVAVFPSVGAGAKHMFRGEVTGAVEEGLKPRIAKTAFALWKLYAGLTTLQVVLLVGCGVGVFDALCHAMTTMSTSGFSTRSASIGSFDSAAVDYVTIAFMLCGSLSFALFFAVLRQRSLKPFRRSLELHVFIAILALATLVTTLGTAPLYDFDLERTFRMALFHVVSCASSTGYFLGEELEHYPSPMLAILVVLMFIGGCAGSTAGGLKIERAVLLAKQSAVALARAFHPSRVRTLRMGRAAVPAEVMSNVTAFFVLYVGVLAVGVLCVSALEGLTLRGAFGATLACLGGTGPAPWLAPELANGFASFSNSGKLVLAVVMVLGRLELFTLLALFVPEFWRR